MDSSSFTSFSPSKALIMCFLVMPAFLFSQMAERLKYLFVNLCRCVVSAPVIAWGFA
jgi:hypothetical protein